jgi:hypothetical protein
MSENFFQVSKEFLAAAEEEEKGEQQRQLGQTIPKCFHNSTKPSG